MVSEDFNDYTEVDFNNYITINSAVEFIFHCQRNKNNYLYIDRDPGGIPTDFKFENSVQVTLHDHTSLAPCFAVADDLGGLNAMWGAGNVEMCWARHYYNATGPIRSINLGAHDGVIGDLDTINGKWADNVEVFFTYQKVGAIFSLKVYSDEARTVLEGSISVDCGEFDTYRYLYACGAWNTGGTPDMIVTIRDFDEPSAASDGSEDLAAGFIVRQSSSQNLAAEFAVGGTVDDSEELLGELIVRHSGSEELLGELVVRQPGSVNLLTGFTVGQPGSEELPAAFEVGQGDWDLPGEFVVRRAASQNLVAELVVRHPGSQDLAASFDGQVSLNLLGEFIVRHPGSAEFLAGLISRQAGLQELLGEFVVRHPGSADLLGELIVRHPGSQDLLSELIVRHSDSEELPGKVIIRHSSLQELAAKFVVRRTGTPLELKMGFKVATYSADLIANIYVRPTTSRATDFVVKDNTRGLTVRDVDRTMTVTAGRRMRAK